MILKHISRTGGSSCQNLVAYVLRYVNDKNEPRKGYIQPFIYRHNLQSRSTAGYIREFQENAKNRINKRSNACTIRHVVLSWKMEDADKINHEVLKTIVRHYITLRGNTNQYLFVQHTDKAHIHIHTCESGSTISGKSNRLTKAEFAQLKLDMDAFQKARFPTLISLPFHGRSKQTKEKSIRQWQKGRMPQKESILTILHTTYARSISIEDFADRLKAKGLEPYYRGKQKKLTGIVYNGSRRFRLTTLGYDEKKLTKLNLIKAREQKELAELKRIRSRAKEREQERGFERELLRQQGFHKRGYGDTPHRDLL